jgi:chitin disaccharide deacetylase
MLFINADDYGRSPEETDAVLVCHKAGRITSTSAMVFMRDSARAAARARESDIVVGLHLNLSERLTGPDTPRHVVVAHGRVISFLTRSKFAVVLYNPLLRDQFRTVVEAQFEEFVRLYGREPAHIDGHQHQHLASNVLLDDLIPAGHLVRRSFSFAADEKGLVNRGYRRCVDALLQRRHKTTDYFFALDHRDRRAHLARVFKLAETATVELMTHPVRPADYDYLMSDAHAEAFRRLRGNGDSRPEIPHCETAVAGQDHGLR